MPPDIRQLNTWAECRFYVLTELEDHGDRLVKVEERSSATSTDVAVLKAGAAFWGSIFGFIAGLIGAIVVAVVLNHLK